MTNILLFSSSGVVGVVAVGVGLAEVVVDLSPEVAGAGVIEDVAEAGHVAPGVDDAGESGPVLVSVVAALEVLIDVAGGVVPAVSHRPVPLELLRHLGGQAVDVLLVELEVDPADVGEVVPADVLPDTQSV